MRRLSDRTVGTRAVRVRLCCALFVGALLTPAAVGRQDPRSAPGFTDRTAAAGLTLTHTPPPSGSDATADQKLAGGAAADFDRDGWQDLFVLGGGGEQDHLFLNAGDGTFVNRTSAWQATHAHTEEEFVGPPGSFLDRAAPWGADRAHLGAGLAVGDVDADGRVDLFVSSHGSPAGLAPGGHLLYMNAGDRFVERAAEAGVATTSPVQADGYGAAFGDIDLDGDLDLFVAGWLGNQSNPSFGNRLFRNDGAGAFTDVTDASGLFLALVHGFTPLFVDMDGDRDQDLLLAADFFTSRYLVNDGSGVFTDLTIPSGTGLDSNGMGQCVADFDGDGRLDWYVTSIEPLGPLDPESGNLLYRGLGDHEYVEISEAVGVNAGGWGWGTVAVDVDHDGWEDIVETNGWPAPPWQGEQSYLFMNQGGQGFVERAKPLGIEHELEGKGLLRFDADNDGDQDLVFFANTQSLAYYRNDLAGPDTHWLHVTLDTGGSPGVAPDGYGARVVAVTPGHAQQRHVDGGGSYLSSSELSAHFGLGAATVVSTLRVDWPDGSVTVLHDVPADQRIVVRH